jgi:ATP-dependent DNA ligase
VVGARGMRRRRLTGFLCTHFHRGRGLCVWAFDLLHHNGRDLRELPLFERKVRLEKLIVATNFDWLRYSEIFDDGIELLKAADRMKLEGIVSKRRDAPYRSGKQCDWIKVKCDLAGGESRTSALVRASPLINSQAGATTTSVPAHS